MLKLLHNTGQLEYCSFKNQKIRQPTQANGCQWFHDIRKAIRLVIDYVCRKQASEQQAHCWPETRLYYVLAVRFMWQEYEFGKRDCCSQSRNIHSDRLPGQKILRRQYLRPKAR